MKEFQFVIRDKLSVSPTSVLPLRAEIRKSIAKTCTLERLEV